MYCILCGKPITGEYLLVSGKGPYCLICVRQRAACDVCGVPVGDGHQILSDGRRICGQCHQTAVYNPTTANAVYEQVRGIITQKLGITLNVPTVLVLVGCDQLSEILRQANHSTDDVTHLLGIYVRHGRKRAIYAQSGLPRLLLMQVIAHEWGHAWQMENAPLLRELQAKEGFAEWVAYKVMAVIGAREILARMENRQDVYGRGLRDVLALERECGEVCVFAWCRQTLE